jgi:hypothetical protein
VAFDGWIQNPKSKIQNPKSKIQKLNHNKPNMEYHNLGGFALFNFLGGLNWKARDLAETGCGSDF